MLQPFLQGTLNQIPSGKNDRKYYLVFDCFKEKLQIKTYPIICVWETIAASTVSERGKL